MLVEQIAIGNSLRNYMYLLACGETKEAMAIDPLDHANALKRASELGWTLTGVINTHEHDDHIRGNKPVLDASGGKLYAPANAGSKIPNVDVALSAGDTIRIGTSVELKVMDTPGHTLSHICLFYSGDEGLDNGGQSPVLLSGDTLFHAGIGNCVNGGDPVSMYQTYADQIYSLPDATRIYPGHDYIINNLEFTLDREPSNSAARSLLTAMQQWNGTQHFVSTIGTERLVNPFFRLNEPELISELQLKFDDLGDNPSDRLVFTKLRELRNHW